MFVGDEMTKNENNNKRKYIYIMALLGVILDQIVKILIHYSFNNLSCVDCLGELIETGGVYKGFNVVPGKGLEIIKNYFYILNPFIQLVNIVIITLLSNALDKP